MQFLVVAYDGTDSEAPARRSAARQAHLEKARQLKAEGHFVEGGALLNEEGQMIGSALILDFPTREQLDKCLAEDPYTTGHVWNEVSITPFRCAPL